MSGSEPAAATRLPAALALLACAALALASLPASAVPPGWLIAFTLPAAVLAALHGVLRRPWQAGLVAIVLQTATCWLALEWVGPMSRPAALACTILPPLAYVTVRQQGSDGSLSLFLSFCVLLVAFILDHISVPITCGFVAAACLALRCAASEATRGIARDPQPRTRRAEQRDLLASSLGLVAPCLAAMFALERSLVLLPSPSRDTGPRHAAADRGATSRVGLSDTFDLDHGNALFDLQADRLVRVRAASGRRLPTDLYLRSSFFAVPGLDNWTQGALDVTSPSPGEGHRLRQPQPGAAPQWLEIERYADALKFVFAPPGTTELRGLGRLLVDTPREWLRQPNGPGSPSYSVAWQDLPLPADLPVEPAAARFGLLALPADLDHARFGELLDEWRVGTTATAAAQQIAAGLARRCRYDLRDPTGPFGRALLDFLFADQDRHGYCMHFASATALLLRLRGIPCRIGVGLYGGDPDPADPAARTFGSRHAHAWVEIPFAGRGYVVFDPTPPAERGRRESRAEATPTDPIDAGDDEPSLRQRLAAALAFLAQPWLLAMLLLAAIATTLWPTRRRRSHGVAPAATPHLRGARRQLQRLLRALADIGCPRASGETLEAFAQRLAAHHGPDPAIAAAFLAYQEVRFGGRPFDEERERRLLDGVAAAAARTPPTAPPAD